MKDDWSTRSNVGWMPDEPQVLLERQARNARDRLAQAIFNECAAIAHEGGDLPYDGVLTAIAERVFTLAGLDTRVLSVQLATLTRASSIAAKRPTDSVAKAAPLPRKTMTPRKTIEVFARDGFRCAYCGENRELQVDHIVPIARGGTDALDNLQTLCRSCNQIKGAK
jgi:5-methylcytosine-specific restriction endonuclease McrA